MIYLISACNCDIALSIARIVKQSDPTAVLIGIAPDGNLPAKAIFDTVLVIPYATAEDYYNKLKQYVVKLKPDIFIPISEHELRYFSSHPEKIQKLGVSFLINNVDYLKIFLDKLSTYYWLKSIGVSVPKTCLLSEASVSDLPLIVKPRSSAGSKNMSIVYTEKQLEALIEHYVLSNTDGLYVAQAYVDVEDSEYTCAVCSFDGDYREIIFHRKLQGGLTGVAEVVKQEEIIELLSTFRKAMSGDYFLNVQLRMKDNIPFVFEINPRFSSTVMMRHKIGFQDFIWASNSCQGIKLDAVDAPHIGTRIYRMPEELIINPIV
jgi:carbamoyl-phosphate synthase large subunit